MCIDSGDLIGFGIATVIMFGSGLGARKYELAVLRWIIWMIGCFILGEGLRLFNGGEHTSKEEWIMLAFLAYSVALPVIAYHLAWINDKGGWIERAP